MLRSNRCNFSTHLLSLPPLAGRSCDCLRQEPLVERGEAISVGNQRLISFHASNTCVFAYMHACMRVNMNFFYVLVQVDIKFNLSILLPSCLVGVLQLLYYPFEVKLQFLVDPVSTQSVEALWVLYACAEQLPIEILCLYLPSLIDNDNDNRTFFLQRHLVHYHSEALPTTAWILNRGFTPKRTNNCKLRTWSKPLRCGQSVIRTHDPPVKRRRLYQCATTPRLRRNCAFSSSVFLIVCVQMATSIFF